MKKIKKRATDQSTLSFFKEVIIKIINSLIDNNYNTIVIILQDISIFLQIGGEFMKLTELQELINKYGENTKFIEIKEELKKLGYPCKIAGEKNVWKF